MSKFELGLAELTLDQFGRVVLPDALLDSVEDCEVVVSAGGNNTQCECPDTTNSYCPGPGGGGSSSNTSCANEYCDGSINGACVNGMFCDGAINAAICRTPNEVPEG